MDKYFLHINELCAQNWDAMTPNGKCKFCNNCKKVVFDFTVATDNEILQHIQKAKGAEFCGRFEEQQLDRWLERTNIKSSNKKLYELLLSFILLSTIQNATAQQSPAQEKIEIKQRTDSSLQGLAIASEIPNESCDTTKKGVFSNTRIRMGAVSTLSANRDPLIVLDGIPIKLSQMKDLNAKKIKSIDVLKPETGTAIYGPDGVNGVIIIQSKYSKKERKKLFAVQ